jgi:D-threo-aldose 1-dehydrogenase
MKSDSGQPRIESDQAVTVPSLPRRRLGSTRLCVTPLCIGASPLASAPRLYGYEVDTERAVSTVLAALSSPINFLDTANGYGDNGESERRIGEGIRRAGGLPDSFVLATKADPDPVTGDFSGARVRRSVEESLDRLGLDHLQLLHLHDPERIGFRSTTESGGAVEALAALRDEGVVDYLGVAGGPIGLLRRYMATGVFDVVLTHNRYTLLDRSAEPLIKEAQASGTGLINAAPYGGGILAKGPAQQPKYGYEIDDVDVRRVVRQLERSCHRYGVPLAAAALQFSTRDPRIGSTVVGVSSPARIRRTLELFAWPIPAALWEELARDTGEMGSTVVGLP